MYSLWIWLDGDYVNSLPLVNEDTSVRDTRDTKAFCNSRVYLEDSYKLVYSYSFLSIYVVSDEI